MLNSTFIYVDFCHCEKPQIDRACLSSSAISSLPVSPTSWLIAFICLLHFMTCLHLSSTLTSVYLSLHIVTCLCLSFFSLQNLPLPVSSAPWLTFTCLFTHHDLPLPVLFSLHDLPLAVSSTPWLNGGFVIHSMTNLYLMTYIWFTFGSLIYSID
mgnify:CR=1 FL=1